MLRHAIRQLCCDSVILDFWIAGAQADADLVKDCVRVRLRAERAEDPGGIVDASFPGGSVSGAK